MNWFQWTVLDVFYWYICIVYILRLHHKRAPNRRKGGDEQEVLATSLTVPDGP